PPFESQNPSTGAAFGAEMPQTPSQSSTLASASTSPAPPVPSTVLPALESLTRESDFTPFMAEGVERTLRNAALKMLFSDPHFNQMDGLDTYIDDYTQPAPMPEKWLRALEREKVEKEKVEKEKAEKERLERASISANRAGASAEATMPEGVPPAAPKGGAVEPQDVPDTRLPGGGDSDDAPHGGSTERPQ
ncbi:MAG: DUF3306 domain-containing protein, partial [Betaproteobacteria bacterium]|nr:DUF3306 domain-containing protein [Betaproteobacteria bacterium]